MIRTFKEENVYYTPESFFLAVITAVGPLTAECANYPCSWRQYPFCNNGANPIPEVKQAIMFGDYTQNRNTAYPIDFASQPFVGQQVLMRFRMLDSNGNNVYEFIAHGGGGAEAPSGCMVVTSVQCSNNVLQVVQSNASGCANCTGGVAYLQYGAAFGLTAGTNAVVPNRWTTLTGDLADCGLAFDGDMFLNNSGTQIDLKVTLQFYFTPDSVAGQSRWVSIVRNSDFNDIPVASFAASNNTYNSIIATGFVQLADGEWFGPAAFSTAAGVSVGGAERVPSTILIEKLCL